MIKFKAMMRCLAILIFILSISLTTRAQLPKVGIEGAVNIPRVVGSQQFRYAFSGTYDFHLAATVKLFEGFRAGLGFSYTFFINNPDIFSYKVTTGAATGASVPYDTKFISQSAFLALKYDRLLSKAIFLSPYLHAGMSFNNYANIYYPDPKPANTLSPYFNAPWLQLGSCVNFISEKYLAFSVNLGYSMLLQKFNAQLPYFSEVTEIKYARNRSIMSWLNIGFGFNLYIPDKSTKKA
jgi:hypothetical protein